MPEQRASRILSALAIRDVLAAFGVEGVPDQAALDKLVSSEVSELVRLQHQDGGFGFWGSDGESQGYVSVHVSHALARAAAAKREVPESMATSLRGYVKSLPERAEKDLDKATHTTVLAYGAYSELAWGSKDTKLADLARTRGGAQLSSEAAGWLLPVFHARGDKAASEALVRMLLNRVSETAGMMKSARRRPTYLMTRETTKSWSTTPTAFTHWKYSALNMPTKRGALTPARAASSAASATKVRSSTYSPVVLTQFRMNMSAPIARR